LSIVNEQKPKARAVKEDGIHDEDDDETGSIACIQSRKNRR
jgi:hypothetical protein